MVYSWNAFLLSRQISFAGAMVMGESHPQPNNQMFHTAIPEYLAYALPMCGVPKSALTLPTRNVMHDYLDLKIEEHCSPYPYSRGAAIVEQFRFV